MCGPSSQQKSLAASEQSFAGLLSANYAQNFGAQSQILQNLTNQFTPIVEAGPGQQGFSPQELAAYQTQAGEGVGTNYAKASQALNTGLAARGGGNEYLPTGAEASLKAGLSSAAANELSQEQLGITRANFAQGRQNWLSAAGGLNALAQEYNPNAIAGEATGANTGAFGEATKVQEMKNQKEMAIAGGIASLVAAPFTGGASLGGLTNLFKGSGGGGDIGGLGAGGTDQYGQYS